jgi:hypothetical protein
MVPAVLPGCFCPVTNFQTIATWVLEKNGVVARTFFVPGTFNIPSAGVNDNLGQSIHFAIALGPECHTALVRDMSGRFRDAKEFLRTRICRFKLQPVVNVNLAVESQRRQESRIKLTRVS